MADPVTLGTVGLGLLGGLFGASTATKPAAPTITPAAAPTAPAAAPTAGGKQSFLSNAAAAAPQSNTAQKTLLGS